MNACENYLQELVDEGLYDSENITHRYMLNLVAVVLYHDTIFPIAIVWVIAMLTSSVSHWLSLWHLGMDTTFGKLKVPGVQVAYLMCCIGIWKQLVSSAKSCKMCMSST